MVAVQGEQAELQGNVGQEEAEKESKYRSRRGGLQVASKGWIQKKNPLFIQEGRGQEAQTQVGRDGERESSCLVKSEGCSWLENRAEGQGPEVSTMLSNMVDTSHVW